MFSSLALALAALQSADVITVTATKGQSPLTEVPAAVTVIEQERLRATRRATGIADLVPGVEAAIANGSQITYQIRGIGAVDHQALTPMAAAVYLDGVFLATNAQTGALLYDAARAEVLKGPQGTLYGRNASSGAINFLTTRPSADQSQYLDLRMSEHGLVTTQGAIGTSFSDTMHARLAFSGVVGPSGIDNVVTIAGVPAPNTAAGEEEATGLRGSLLKELDGGSILLRAHRETDRGINPSPLNDALSLDEHEISIDPSGIQNTDTDFWGASIDVELPLGTWDTVAQLSYEAYDQNYGFDFDGTPAPFGNPNLNANLNYDREFSQYTAELRGNKVLENGVSLLIGGMAAYEVFEQDYLIWCGELDRATKLGTCPYVGAPGRVGPTPASATDAFSLLTRIEQNRNVGALFGRSDVPLPNDITLTLGARLTHEKIEGSGFGVHIFEDGTVAFNDRDGLGDAIGENEIKETKLTGTLALRRPIGPGTAYASLATGYKSGGFNGEVQNNALHFSDEGLFGAEDVTALEVGYRASGSKVSGSLGIFYQWYDDPQARIFVRFPQPDGSEIISNSLANLDGAISYGVEVELRAQISGNLNIHLGGNLLETEIQQDDGNVPTGNAATFDGNPLPFAPEWSATIGLDYSRPTAMGEVFISTNAKARGARFLDAEGRSDRRQTGYNLFTAEIGHDWKDSGVSLSFYGNNLTDTDYAVSGFGFIGYNTFRGQPRELGVRLGLTF